MGMWILPGQLITEGSQIREGARPHCNTCVLPVLVWHLHARVCGAMWTWVGHPFQVGRKLVAKRVDRRALTIRFSPQLHSPAWVK